MSTAGRRWKFWFYLNGRKIHDSAMTGEELDRAGRTAYQMLRPADQWLMVTQDLDSVEAPWFTGNDRTTAERVIPELFPGMKVPAGEVDWQRSHGVRMPPEAELGITHQLPR